MNFKPGFFVLTALLLLAASSASYAVNAEMTVLQEQYEKTLDEHHKDVYEPAFKQLTANYFTGLERSIAEGKKAGDLQTVLALEAESKRIIKKEPLPANDEQAVKPLQKLRAIYRAEIAKLDAQQEAKKATLLPSYLALLKKLEIELTQSGRIDAAKEVMDYRESLAATAPAATRPAATRPESALEAAMPVTITSATYADPSGRHKQDITKHIRQVYKAGLPTMILDTRDGAEGKDPSPGVQKQTTIIFTIRGQTKTKTFPEGYQLNFKKDLK